MRDRVIVRLRRASGAGRRVPSDSLSRAITSLAHSEEMRPLLCEANAEGKALAIDVFHDRAGSPILVHFSKENVD